MVDGDPDTTNNLYVETRQLNKRIYVFILFILHFHLFAILTHFIFARSNLISCFDRPLLPPDQSEGNQR